MRLEEGEHTEESYAGETKLAAKEEPVEVVEHTGPEWKSEEVDNAPAWAGEVQARVSAEEEEGSSWPELTALAEEEEDRTEFYSPAARSEEARNDAAVAAAAAVEEESLHTMINSAVPR